jgi:hypothetical protein
MMAVLTLHQTTRRRMFHRKTSKTTTLPTTSNPLIHYLLMIKFMIILL